MKTWLPLLFLAGLLAGCKTFNPRSDREGMTWVANTEVSPGSTDEIRKQEYPTWPKSVREEVDQRLVLVGMTRNQVQVSTRIEAKRIQGAMAAPNGPVETWVLWRLMSGWSPVKMHHSIMVTITFRNGVVTKIDSVTVK